jgi:hypothetical protein
MSLLDHGQRAKAIVFDLIEPVRIIERIRLADQRHGIGKETTCRVADGCLTKENLGMPPMTYTSWETSIRRARDRAKG